MEETITMSELNDFIFCPASIYFHGLYGSLEPIIYQSKYQIRGTGAHKTITNNTYTTSKNILQNIYVYTSKHNILGKIDLFDIEKSTIIERKYKINELYDGQVFQVYAQFFGLLELGYEVKKIKIHSLSDNKTYLIELPKDDNLLYQKFISTLEQIKSFDLNTFVQTNKRKCEKCIYSNLCDRSLII